MAGGGAGIRTLDASFSSHTPLAGEPLQPLGHASKPSAHSSMSRGYSAATARPVVRPAQARLPVPSKDTRMPLRRHVSTKTAVCRTGNQRSFLYDSETNSTATSDTAATATIMYAGIISFSVRWINHEATKGVRPPRIPIVKL